MSDSLRWTADRAWAWYRAQPWLMGFNFIPSTAVNTTEFWQASSFDPVTIDRELGWAAAAGFNTTRVFVQYLVFEHDPIGLLNRFDQFLGMAAKHGISVMPVLFDDCAFSKKQPFLGVQDEPLEDRMMSSWTASPGHDRVRSKAAWPGLKKYVTEFVRRFGKDARVLMWDLYNEPGNEGMGDDARPLLEASFDWARGSGVLPMQPITVGVWMENEAMVGINKVCNEKSDVLSFHRYGDLANTNEIVSRMSALGRPLVCTEYMARTIGSRIETHLPMFKDKHVGCYIWGLVNGRTRTHKPWVFLKDQIQSEEWFHDVFHGDGKVYKGTEMAVLRRMSPRN